MHKISQTALTFSFIIITFLLTDVSQVSAQSATLPGKSEATSTTEAYWPTPEWRTSTPEAQGMDTEKLAQMLDMVTQQNLNLHSLLIIRNGYIVSEHYFHYYYPQEKHVQFSCTKSFIATLVGIAREQGKLDINRPVLDFFPEHTFEHRDALKEAMTVEDLLTMRSGLDWREGDPIYQAMYRSRDWVQFVLNTPMATQPGTQFNYCSGCSHLLSAIIQPTTGQNTQDFAQKVLFDPLGITDLRWERDTQGITLGGWGLELTSRDMAKLGYLYLHNGIWDGQRIVSADWIATATQQHTATDGKLGYGYQWWTYPLFGAYSALGRAGQTIFVVPDLNLIIVTTADLNGHDEIFNLIEMYIVPAVLNP